MRERAELLAGIALRKANALLVLVGLFGFVASALFPLIKGTIIRARSRVQPSD